MQVFSRGLETKQSTTFGHGQRLHLQRGLTIQGKVLSHLSVLLFAYKSPKGEENLNPKNAIFGTIELLKPIAKLSMSNVVKCKLLAIKVSL